MELPLYIQQKIIKYCFFDDNSKFKWKLSLDLISRKHFEYISKCFTKFNGNLLLSLEPTEIIEKLSNRYCPFKYPLMLNCSVDILFSFIKKYYFPALLNCLGKGNLNSINLKFDYSISSTIPISEIISTILPNLITYNQDLSKFKFSSNEKQTDLSTSVYQPFLKSGNNNLKEISLKMVSLNVNEFSEFLTSYQVKSSNLIGRSLGGIEKLKLKSFAGFGYPIKIDSLQFQLLSNIKVVNLTNSIIDSPSQFFSKLLNLQNLKSLIIPYITFSNSILSDPSLISEYQQIFNRDLYGFIKSKRMKLQKLETPFPVDQDILDEVASSNHIISSLSITPNSNSMVTFNKSLKKLVLKSGYSNSTFQNFCLLNLNSSIQSIEINNIGASYLVPYFTEFIGKNSNISTLICNESINCIDLIPILISVNLKQTIHSLSLVVSENSTDLSNTNLIFNQLSCCPSITQFQLSLYFYFQGFKFDLIDSKNFNLISIKDYKLLFFNYNNNLNKIK